MSAKPEDPSILLTGATRVGATAAQIVAIRVNPSLGWDPDFKRDIAKDSYQANGLDVVLETSLQEIQVVASQLEELLGGSDSGVMHLATGQYKVWVMLASIGS